MIQPWEKSLISSISKAIIDANLGFNPSSDGNVIHINVPALTEERRKELVKRVKVEGENAKIGVRNARKEGNEEIRKLQKDGLSEDLAKQGETQVQEMTDKHTANIEALVAAKEKEIMTV
jgi:ribosome recycling factor